MMQNKLVFLLVIAVFVCLFHLSWADDKKDMVLIGGEHGCGPKLLYKSGKIGAAKVLTQSHKLLCSRWKEERRLYFDEWLQAEAPGVSLCAVSNLLSYKSRLWWWRSWWRLRWLLNIKHSISAINLTFCHALTINLIHCRFLTIKLILKMFWVYADRGRYCLQKSLKNIKHVLSLVARLIFLLQFLHLVLFIWFVSYSKCFPEVRQQLGGKNATY